ncbi:CapA family protein [Candidatus Poribacteria bacterium]
MLPGEVRIRVNIAILILVAILVGAAVPARGEGQKPSESFSLVAVGDIMLDRGVGQKIEKRGTGFPFGNVARLLQVADLAFGNLESPISSLGTLTKGKEVTFRAALDAVSGMRDAGIDVVSLANNHAMDYGPNALVETMDVLAHSGVVYVGAGANSAAARRPADLTIRGVKISLLAYTYKFYMVVEAQERQPGVAIASGEQIKADVHKAKEWADVVIVSFHWGWEYSDHPDKETRELAHLTVEAGADLVIGHHPHVIQGVEVYKGGLICYSLGNFIFDQSSIRTRRGLLFRCDIGKSGVQKAEFLPVAIDAAEFRPGLASDTVGKSILLELKRLSKQLKTNLELKGNTAIVLKKEAMLIGT